MLEFEILENHHAILVDTDRYQIDTVLKAINDSLIKTVSKYNIELIEPDGKVIKKEQIQTLKKNMALTSINSDTYYIIKSAEKMNASSYNALLKFLEEPPSGVHIILITADLNGIPETIKSRCIRKNVKLNVNIELIEYEEILRCIKDRDYIGFKKEVAHLVKDKNNLDELENVLYAMISEAQNKVQLLKIISDFKYNTNFDLLVDKIYLNLIK